MLDREMTPSEAIIVLDHLNTDGRIEVDRDELRAAIRAAKAALRKQIPVKPIRKSVFITPADFQCPTCKNEFSIEWETPYCGQCGQAFDLSN